MKSDYMYIRLKYCNILNYVLLLNHYFDVYSFKLIILVNSDLFGFICYRFFFVCINFKSIISQAFRQKTIISTIESPFELVFHHYSTHLT